MTPDPCEEDLEEANALMIAECHCHDAVMSENAEPIYKPDCPFCLATALRRAREEQREEDARIAYETVSRDCYVRQTDTAKLVARAIRSASPSPTTDGGGA